MVPSAVAIVTCEGELADWLKHSTSCVTIGLRVNGAIMKQHLREFLVRSSLDPRSK